MRHSWNLASDIFGNKNYLRGPADELVLRGAGLGRDQREHRGAVGRGDGYPAAGLKLGVEGQIESKLIQIESQASLLIANEDVDRVNADR